jgi:crotonobetainyl-CoA:carnitine CoA-transferase CaiB-like acyl-CoA transferase
MDVRIMAGPLDGFKIIDLTSNITGPLATMTLADQGANVIKVEMPGLGDHVRSTSTSINGLSAAFLNNNRNKRSIAIDLKTDRGLAALYRVISGADVFIQNFRPGVAERLRISEVEIRKIVSDIIYVSISGFGQKGPYAQKPAYDPVIQALCGIATVQAGSDEARPRLIRTILPDKLTAITAAQAILAALLSRSKTRKGQHVRLSMLDTLISFLWSSDMNRHTFISEADRGEKAASKIDLIYNTKDGYMTVAVNTNREWLGLAQALEHPEWLEDNRFSTPNLRAQNIDIRLELIQEVLARKSTEHWIDRLNKERVPCSPVLTRQEMLDNEQVQANSIIVEYAHEKAGPIRQARAAAQFSLTPTAKPVGAPGLGQHSKEILLEAGLQEEDILSLVSDGVVEA